MYNKNPFFLDKHLLGSHHRNCCCRIFFHDEEVHELETWFRSHFHGFYDLSVFIEKNFLITIEYLLHVIFKHLVNDIYNHTPYPLLWLLHSKIWVVLWYMAQLHVFNQHIPFKLSWAFVCRHLVDVSYISCCSVVDVVVSASH